MTVTRSQPPRIPALARRLDLVLWQRSQERMRDRYGFDLSNPDAAARAGDRFAANPDCDGHLLKCALLAAGGDLAAALTVAQQAVDLDPSSARAQTTLATLLVNSGRPDEGLAAARRAAELDPDDPGVLYNVGLAEHVAGDPRAADVAFRRAAELLGMTPPRWQIWRR